MTWPVVPTTGTGATTASKTANCALQGTTYTCIVVGQNTTSLVDGVLVNLAITLPRNAPSGTTSLGLTQVIAAATDTGGYAYSAPITVSAPFVLSTASLCDVNSDGRVDATDYTNVLQQSLGVTACISGDLNADTKCNVLDLITVAGAIPAGVCAAR
jgi:hypothetical protein